jgi:hypothetical protein
LITGLLISHHAPARAQAPEARLDRVLYVDRAHPRASDGNPGSPALPFETIGRAAAVAVANNARNLGTRVLIGPGTYREGISLPESGRETDAPIVFEALGEVVVSGSDLFTGWQRAGKSGVFTRPWPYRWGLATVPHGWEPHVTLQDIVRRREAVFVNGRPLGQVLSLAELDAGGFHVDEQARTIHIQPPTSTEIDKAVVEIAVRPALLAVFGKRNFVLRGVIFQHANTALDGQAVRFDDSSDILVEDCRFRWNNWGGLGFGHARNVTARRNAVHHNGGAGIVTWKTRQVLFEDNDTSHNNWRGKAGGFTDWAVAGMKNLHTHGGLFLRHQARDNQTHGIWFDTDCERVLVDESVFCANLGHGVYLEANQGPVTLRHSRVCRNRHSGILIANSARVNLERNVIHGNAAGQIMVSGLYDAPRPEKDWETGAVRAHLAEHAAWAGNVVVGTQAGQLLVSTTLSPPLWGHFVDSLTSGRNIWFNPRDPDVFQLAGGRRTDFNGWQVATHQDGGSLFADPRLKDPENDDFSPMPQSPLRLMEGAGPGPGR